MSRIPDTHAVYPDEHPAVQEVGPRHDLGSEISPPLSPRTQPPDYFDEGAPPGYQEKAAKSSRLKVKKVVFIRIVTSLFVMTMVAVIIGAVVGKIHNGKPPSSTIKDKEPQEGVRKIIESLTTITVTTTSTISTGQLGHHLQIITTSASRPLPIPTNAHVAFDCPMFGQAASTATADDDGSMFRPVCTAVDQEQDEKNNIIGTSMYSYQNCHLARVSHLSCGWGMGYRCTASCQSSEDGDLIGDVLVDDWEWDSG